jgi:hypothetical protein
LPFSPTAARSINPRFSCCPSQNGLLPECHELAQFFLWPRVSPSSASDSPSSLGPSENRTITLRWSSSAASTGHFSYRSVGRCFSGSRPTSLHSHRRTLARDRRVTRAVAHRLLRPHASPNCS